MDKEEFLSKLNIKDYNNQLEKILEKKSFSEGTKNILLNILYKLENSYEDYTKVKVSMKSKKEILEDVITIVDNKCDEIELVKPKLNESTKLGEKKFIVEKNRKKIISYPNERTVFYAICHLNDDKFIINKKYDFLKEPMKKLLNNGYIMEQEEIIRDFDGWSWNISSEDIDNHIYNIVYQNIKILTGEKFLQEYIDNNKTIDFIDRFEKKISNVCSEKTANEIITTIYQIAIMENIKNDKEKQNELIALGKKLKKDLEKMENKKVYLQELADKKKVIGKKIREIDETINDNRLLREKFIEQNRKLKDGEKIFSLSEYSEILQNNRKKLLQQLKEYGTLMKPMNYVKMKSELNKKVYILSKIDFNSKIENEINEKLIKLQIMFLKALDEKIKKIETKKMIIKYVYLFRYYKLLKINEKMQIKDMESLNQELINTERYLITRACNLKAITILSNNIEKNYEIISKILNFNIIDLEEMHIELNKQEGKKILNIYDDNIINNRIEYDEKEELNIKPNKKVKLFIY